MSNPDYIDFSDIQPATADSGNSVWHGLAGDAYQPITTSPSRTYALDQANNGTLIIPPLTESDFQREQQRSREANDRQRRTDENREGLYDKEKVVKTEDYTHEDSDGKMTKMTHTISKGEAQKLMDDSIRFKTKDGFEYDRKKDGTIVVKDGSGTTYKFNPDNSLEITKDGKTTKHKHTDREIGRDGGTEFLEYEGGIKLVRKNDDVNDDFGVKVSFTKDGLPTVSFESSPLLRKEDVPVVSIERFNKK